MHQKSIRIISALMLIPLVLIVLNLLGANIMHTSFAQTDTDGDGVPDELDECPDRPGTLPNGCQTDTDGDGIVDYFDECPEQPAPGTEFGCPTDDEPAPPPDSDGDGIIDSEDVCPDTPGIPETNGCPDADGDGIADNMDECPNLAGQPRLDGCPPLPGLPGGDVCSLATDGYFQVNVRAQPTTDADIVAQLDTFSTYTASGRNDAGTWYFVEEVGNDWEAWQGDQPGSWVSSNVIRTDGNCQDLPTPGIGAGMSGPAWSDLESVPDLDETFAECNDLVSSIRRLPIHVTQALVYSGNPCEMGRNLVEDLTFGDGQLPPLPYDVIEQCPQQALSSSLTLMRLQELDPDLYERVRAALEADDDACGTLRGGVGFDPNLIDLNRTDAAKIVGATCLPYLSNNQILSYAEDSPFAMQVQLYMDNPDIGIIDGIFCKNVGYAWEYGNLDEGPGDLYGRLVNECGMYANPSRLNTIMRTALANQNYADDTDIVHLCQNPLDAVKQSRGSYDAPAQLAGCLVDAQLLEYHNHELPPIGVISILNTNNPCRAARSYLGFGVFHIPDSVGVGVQQCFSADEWGNLFPDDAFGALPPLPYVRGSQPIIQGDDLFPGDMWLPDEMLSPTVPSPDDGWSPQAYFASDDTSTWDSKLAMAEATTDGYCNPPTQFAMASFNASVDLYINALELAPDVPVNGNQVNVTVEIGNRASEDVNSSFDVEWWAGTNYSSPACTWTVNSLQAGSTQQLTCTYSGYPSPYANLDTKAVVDASNAILEVSESNNEMLDTIRVTSQVDADLIVSASISPALPTQKQPVDVTVRVTNQGSQDVSSSFDVEWRGGVNFTSPGCTWTVNGLQTGASQELTCSYSGFASWYTQIDMLAEVDVNNTVSESDETNNSFTERIAVTETTQSDLVVDYLNLTPGVPVVNGSVQVEVGIRNQGSQDVTSAFDIEWWAGTNYSSPACTWTENGLNAGESTTLNCTYNGYPSPYANLDTQAAVDAGNSISEYNEGNNALTKSITVSQDAQQDPDLAATFTSIPNKALVGQTFSITVAVTNTGSTATGSYSVALMEGSNRLAQQQVSSTGAQATESVVFTLSFPNAGTKQIRAFIDNNNTVTESDENNNTVNAAVIIVPNGTVSVDYELAVNGQYADSSPGLSTTTGANLAWTHTINNNGQVEVEIVRLVDSQGNDISQQCGTGLPTTLSSGNAITCQSTSPAQSGQHSRFGTVVWREPGSNTQASSDAAYYLAQPPVGDVALSLTVNGQTANTAPGLQTTPGTQLTWEFTITNSGSANLSVDAVMGINGQLISSNCTPSLPTPIPAGSGQSVTCQQTTTAQAGQHSGNGSVQVFFPNLNTKNYAYAHAWYTARQPGGQPGQQPPATSTPPPTTTPQPDQQSSDLQQQTGTVSDAIPDNLSAVFTVIDNNQTDVYLVSEGEVKPLADNPDINEDYAALSPNGRLVAYLVTDSAGQRQVVVMNLSRNIGLPILADSDRLSIAPATPGWSAGGHLLLTMEDTNGNRGIYELATSANATDQTPQLIIEDAADAIYAPNERLIAFVRVRNGVPNIFTQEAESGNIVPITSQTSGVGCGSPVFGHGSLKLFFVCGETLYRYDLDGLTDITPQAVETVARPAIGTESSLLLFDNGEVIYLTRLNEGRSIEMINLMERDALRISVTRNASE